jgi:hypothetical protein
MYELSKFPAFVFDNKTTTKSNISVEKIFSIPAKKISLSQTINWKCFSSFVFCENNNNRFLRIGDIEFGDEIRTYFVMYNKKANQIFILYKSINVNVPKEYFILLIDDKNTLFDKYIELIMEDDWWFLMNSFSDKDDELEMFRIVNGIELLKFENENI